MDLLHIILLSLIQGLTEFLPVSSSAHLLLPMELLGWEDQGLAFDVAVHFGTLIAVMLYFRSDIKTLLCAWWMSIRRRSLTVESTLAWWIILATLPSILAGLLFADVISATLRTAQVIAVTTVVFALLLAWADYKPKQLIDERALTWRQALMIGCAQAIALIPGTSRSGITMTAGLMLGMTRVAAARFSFLLSIPLILAAATYMSAKGFKADVAFDGTAIVLGVCFSFISAFACIHMFLKVIQKIGMMPFVIYRLCLGALLFYVFF